VLGAAHPGSPLSTSSAPCGSGGTLSRSRSRCDRACPASRSSRSPRARRRDRLCDSQHARWAPARAGAVQRSGRSPARPAASVRRRVGPPLNCSIATCMRCCRESPRRVASRRNAADRPCPKAPPAIHSRVPDRSRRHDARADPAAPAKPRHLTVAARAGQVACGTSRRACGTPSVGGTRRCSG
jgi:hypothetical protein